MESQNRSILITAVVLVLLLLGAGVLYWHYTRPPAAPPTVEQPKTMEPSQPPPSAEVKAGEEKEAPFLPEVKIPALDQSDDFVRQMMKNLSPHGKLGEWLKVKNIIRVFVAAVDNIANGKSPRPQLGFLSPGQAFPVSEKGDRIYLDPKGYERFDIITDAIVSLSSSRTVQAYQKLKPLFQEAYRELGYPQKDFHATFIQAMKRILDTPIVEREVLLREEGKGLNYVFIDDGLENMSEVQKHLLRMGPKNTQKIQQKVREITLALGVPETQLPQAQIYIPRAR
jgi:Protein of unknown function (DUF3014)